MTAQESEYLGGLAKEIAAEVAALLKTDTEPEQFLSAQQIASEYSVDPRTVRGWIESGRLESVKIGGARRVARSKLAEFVEAGA